MRKLLSNVTILLMCMIILLSSVNLSVIVNEIAVLDIDISSIFGTSKNSKFENKSIIVTAESHNFDTYGATSVEEHNGIFMLTYETEKQAKTAYNNYKKTQGIASVEANITLQVQSENIKETINNEEDEQTKLQKKREALQKLRKWDLQNLQIQAQNIEKREQEQEEVTKEKTELAKHLEENQNTEKEVKVAILDTGINLQNQNLQNRIINLEKNFSKEGEKTDISDYNGHGTEMAEIIANNTSSAVKIVPIKIADANGKAKILDAYLGIKEAIKNKVDIINISMNALISNESKLLEDVINEANEKGIKVVVSAGNGKTSTRKITPSNIDSAIVVSAVNNDNTFADYSNYGSSVDYSSYGTYNGKQGTSYGAANVTSIIANIIAKGEDIAILDDYAIDLGEEGKDKKYGKGLIAFEKYDVEVNKEQASKVIEDDEIENEERQAYEADGNVFDLNTSATTYNFKVKFVGPSGTEEHKVTINMQDGSNFSIATDRLTIYDLYGFSIAPQWTHLRQVGSGSRQIAVFTVTYTQPAYTTATCTQIGMTEGNGRFGTKAYDANNNGEETFGGKVDGLTTANTNRTITVQFNIGQSGATMVITFTECAHPYWNLISDTSTCTQAGTQTFSCSTCGKQTTGVGAALGHVERNRMVKRCIKPLAYMYKMWDSIKHWGTYSTSRLYI